MKIYLSRGLNLIILILTLSLVGCASSGPSYGPAMANYYPNQPNTMPVNDVLTPTPSYFNYNYPINYGHSDIHSTDNYNTLNNNEPLTTRYY